jgi:putative hydrolase of the HAD superfamily
MQLKAIIFDYGNVLSEPQGRAEIEAMAALFEAPVDVFEKAYWRDRLAYDAAGLTPPAYWNAVGEQLSHALSGREFERAIALDSRSWGYPRAVVVKWAKALSAAGMRTAVLSNMPVALREYVENDCPWMPRFDQRTYSCDLGLAKPAPEIFRHCLNGLGVDPGEALFLDDRMENVRAARDLGIHALEFRSPEQVQCEMNGSFKLPATILP